MTVIIGIAGVRSLVGFLNACLTGSKSGVLALVYGDDEVVKSGRATE